MFLPGPYARGVTAPTAETLLPRPNHLKVGDAEITLPPRCPVAVAPELTGAWPLLRDVLGVRLGLDVVRAPSDASISHGEGDDDAHSAVVLRHNPALGAEAYRLAVSPGQVLVTIEASSARGAIHAVRTLQQLAGPRAFRATPLNTGGPEGPREPSQGPRDGVTLPAVTISDSPRLDHRGVLLDVARHFLPKDQVMRFIELTSQHKLNVLHLHLTDDQGWRLPVPGYPRLADVAAWRRASPVDAARGGPLDSTPHGGWYTAEDLREIAAFARTRGVAVVPEIDLPGHAQALLAAYPELAPAAAVQDRPEVWTGFGLNPHVLGTHLSALTFAKAALDQLAAIFDSALVCIGGDEVDTRDWAADPATRAQAEALGLESVRDLLPWFSTQLAEHLAGHGRRTSVWDEVSGEGLPSGVVINVWRTASSAVDAIAAGHDVVQCPESVLYLDHRAGLGPEEPVPVGGLHTIEDVYRYEPATAEILAAQREPGAGRLLGAQANVWREYLPDARRTDYATFPRLCAAAESFWSDERDWDDFSRRLPAHLARLDAAGVEYRPLTGPHPWQQRPALRGRAIGEP